MRGRARLHLKRGAFAVHAGDDRGGTEGDELRLGLNWKIFAVVPAVVAVSASVTTASLTDAQMLDIYAQWRANRHRFIPRNSDLAIAADGTYQYCFNDIRHSHPLGHVAGMSIREALAAREQLGADPRLCGGCGVRRRYGPAELGRVLLAYLRARSNVTA